MRRTARRRSALLVIVAALIPVWVAAQPSSPESTDELRREVLARFEVVPLRDGVALAGRGRVEVVDGLVLSGGTPLSGAEVRERLGTDAPLALRLSYLDNATLRQMFGPAPGSAAMPVAAPPLETPAADTPAPVPAPAPAAPASTAPHSASTSRTYRRTGARLAVGKSVTVAEDEEVSDGVVVLAGNARIAGRVRDEVVVIGGNVELTSSADVRGDITAVGGQVVIAPGARHSGAVHQAALDEWTGWSWPRLGWPWMENREASRWLMLGTTLTRVGLLTAAMGLVVLLARSRVGRIGDFATSRPVRAGAVGLVMQVLFVPALVVVSLLMAITIIGLPFIAVVIPLALAAMFASMLLGFTSFAHALGAWAGRRLGWSTDTAVWAAVLGLGLIVLPTVVARLLGVAPDFVRAGAFVLLAAGTLLEYVAWTIGLGAAVMTGFGASSGAPPPLPMVDPDTAAG